MGVQGVFRRIYEKVSGSRTAAEDYVPLASIALKAGRYQIGDQISAALVSRVYVVDFESSFSSRAAAVHTTEVVAFKDGKAQ